MTGKTSSENLATAYDVGFRDGVRAERERIASGATEDRGLLTEASVARLRELLRLLLQELGE